MRNVLVVEDDIKLNQIVCASLRKSGYDAKGCTRPSEAYELMFNAFFDCIVSDITMPGEDGFSFAETVRGLNKDIPMRTLSAASRRVTEGDFSVRLAPRRSDGKKDYAEVMYEDFNIMVEELASTETMKSDFIANVSHEIKTPLAIIQNYADALRDPDLSWEEHSEYTDTIVTASQKLNTLVANILKLSKLENQEITPAFTRFDLCRQLGNCVLSFESLWERKGITFEADMDDRAVINSDPELLEIVWNNLLSNALKFTEPGGSVTLTQTSEPDGVTVAITDTGCGMDEHTTPRIFDKFYQGDLSRGSEGNGLGLALVARVSEILGAHIDVKSKPDSGTTFTVILKTGL
jgi:signal transduction histidine kinase